MIGDNRTLKELIQIAIPIDEATHSKEFFLEKIDSELEREFSKKCTEEFRELIRKKRGVYFIVNVSMEKRNRVKPTIKLSKCGKEEVPTISLNC